MAAHRKAQSGPPAIEVILSKLVSEPEDCLRQRLNLAMSYSECRWELKTEPHCGCSHLCCLQTVARDGALLVLQSNRDHASKPAFAGNGSRDLHKDKGALRMGNTYVLPSGPVCPEYASVLWHPRRQTTCLILDQSLAALACDAPP